MCCIFTTLVLLGPRITGLFWWIARPGYWQAAFNGSWLWPILGLIFLPWTTLMYLLLYPNGIVGFEWFLIVLSVISDIVTYTGGAYGNRRYIPGATASA